MVGETSSSEGRNARGEARFLGSANPALNPDRPPDTLELIEQDQSACTEMSGGI